MHRCGVLVSIFASPNWKKCQGVIQATSLAAPTTGDGFLVAVKQKPSVSKQIKGVTG